MRKLVLLGLTAGFMLSSLCHAQESLPEGWISREFRLPSSCKGWGNNSNFDAVQEERDDRYHVRSLVFYKKSLKDAYQRVEISCDERDFIYFASLSYVALGKSYEIKWTLDQESSTYAVSQIWGEYLNWEEITSNSFAGKRDRATIPKYLFFKPSIGAYWKFNCTSLWE